MDNDFHKVILFSSWARTAATHEYSMSVWLPSYQSDVSRSNEVTSRPNYSCMSLNYEVMFREMHCGGTYVIVLT